MSNSGTKMDRGHVAACMIAAGAALVLIAGIASRGVASYNAASSPAAPSAPVNAPKGPVCPTFICD